MVGRTPELEHFSLLLERLSSGRPAKSMIISGMRGVGKTVLLNTFEDIAQEANPRWYVQQAEISRNTELAGTMARICRRLLISMSRSERMKDRAIKALQVLKSFSASINGVDVSVGFDIDMLVGRADSGDLAEDLRDLLLEVGEVARRGDTGALILFDEVHRLKRDDYEALILALHRVKQKGLPVAFVGAGLPLLPALTGQAKTYASRLFLYPTIGALSEKDANDALVIPAQVEGVTYEQDAVTQIINRTEGYPYFVQEYGEHVWVSSNEPTITLAEVDAVFNKVLAYLDKNFFKVHIGQLGDSKERYVSALANLGDGPQLSSAVAEKLGMRTSDLSTIRDRLMKDDLVYAPKLNYMDFTVPYCADYIRRHYPLDAIMSGSR